MEPVSFGTDGEFGGLQFPDIDREIREGDRFEMAYDNKQLHVPKGTPFTIQLIFTSPGGWQVCIKHEFDGEIPEERREGLDGEENDTDTIPADIFAEVWNDGGFTKLS